MEFWRVWLWKGKSAAQGKKPVLAEYENGPRAGERIRHARLRERLESSGSERRGACGHSREQDGEPSGLGRALGGRDREVRWLRRYEALRKFIVKCRLLYVRDQFFLFKSNL